MSIYLSKLLTILVDFFLSETTQSRTTPRGSRRNRNGKNRRWMMRHTSRTTVYSADEGDELEEATMGG